MIDRINPSYVMWLLALPSPIMAFLILVWVRYTAKIFSKKGNAIILNIKKMIIISLWLGFWMTFGTTVISFMLSKIGTFTVEWKTWLLAVVLTFIIWAGGIFLGQLIFVRLFGHTLYAGET